MAFWASNDLFDLPIPSNAGASQGWGLDAIDGGNQAWDNWFAGLEGSDDQRQRRRHASTGAQPSFQPTRSPSPEHGGYTSWLTGNHPTSTRDATSRRPDSTPIALSASGLANPPSFSDRRQPRPAASTSNPRQPAPNHSSNWLDPTEARRPPRETQFPDPFATLDSYSYSDSATSFSTHESDYSSGINIDDLLAGNEDPAMPPSTRRSQREQPRSSIVDLTNDPPSPPDPSSRTRKRAREPLPEAHDNSTKRRRPSHSNNNSSSPKPLATAAVEELDLTNENPSAEEELLRTQQAAAIAAQQSSTSSDPDKPFRVGQRTCIICMEPYTNATMTSCGHIYCHECLTQALMAGEKNSERGVGNCPVCRKPVSRKKDKQMILVNFMRGEAWREQRAVRA